MLTTVAAVLGACSVVAAAGCGDDDSPPAAAKVGDTPISAAELERRLAAAERLRDTPAISRTLPPPKELRKQFTRALIQSEWVRQEAQAQGVRLKPWGVRAWMDAQFNATRRTADLRTARTLAEMQGGIEQARTALYMERLAERIAQPVTAADVEGYLRRHRKELAIPEVRHLNVVVAPTEARIRRAYAALRRGASWKEVVRDYSVDELSREHRTKWVATTRGELDPRLSRAAFAARRGELVGPLRTRSGWYLFSISLIQPGAPATLRRTRSTILQALESRRREQAAAELQQLLERKYQRRTVCANGVQLAECRTTFAGPIER